MTDHTDCTCCRHWRKVEQPCLGVPGADETPDQRAVREARDAVPEGEPIAVLPPRPDGVSLA